MEGYAGLDPSKSLPMRSLAPSLAVAGFDEAVLGYSKREAVAEASRAVGHDLSKASSACPFGVDVGALTDAVSIGDFALAHDVVTRAHPWPGILGRSCWRPCEAEAALDEKGRLFVSALERAASDHGHAAQTTFRPGPPTGYRIAIIGTGSSGSATAYRLRKYGHAVAMFDQMPYAGGMLATGYPDFRLPLEVVRRENDLRGWGVELHLGRRVEATLFEDLARRHHAVVLATGKFKGASLELEGEGLRCVQTALDFRVTKVYGKVIVIGGGHTAADVARTVRRLGGEVSVYYHRSREDMPVRPALREAHLALQAAEGIAYVFNASPVRLVGADGVVAAAAFRHTTDIEADRSMRTTVSTGSEFTVHCDRAIVAVGEVADLSYLPPSIRRTDDGHIASDHATFETSHHGVFAVGEMTGMKGTMNALRAGFACADAVDAALRSALVPQVMR
jgi:NADPH-dependent glutamate synthase beta subunit-like oxidoreductase